jgi:hypothetical protein
LCALTAAALALPGLTPSPTLAANGDGFSFEYHHYEEDKRDLDGENYKNLNLKPLQADSLSLGMHGSVTDRVTFGLNYTQDTWSGATPVTTVPHAAITDQLFSGASSPTAYSTDATHHPVTVNWNTYNGTTVQYINDARLVHVMASASPETRRQIDGKVGYQWDNATLNLGGGISHEPDFQSYFVNADGQLDFNQKLTTLSWGGSFTVSDIDASLAANAAADWGAYLDKIRLKNGVSTLFGGRHEVSFNVGVTQVLNKDSLIEGSLGFTRSTGYLSNPYKATILAFDDPNQFIDSTGLRTVVLKGTLEQRPTLRNQWTFDTRFVQYIDSFDAALHVNYRYYHDDWGINAHTLDLSWYQPLGDGWMVVPGARYYTQSAANFYKPYFLFNQAFPILLPRNPELPMQLDHSQLQIQTFSSDERLSAFGTLAGQLAISKQLLNSTRVELGAEYSTHAGSLKLGGGGEQSYADFRSYTLYVSLNVDLAGRYLPDEQERSTSNSAIGDDPDDGNEGRSGRRVAAPAGVEFTHLLDNAGEFAMDLRHTYGIQGGDTLRGAHTVSDSVVAAQGCGGQLCSRTASNNYSHVSTLELLYAPVNGWTLMIAPQFVDLHMDQRDLGGGFSSGGIFFPGANGPSLRHTTGGLGDTGVYALTELFASPSQHIDIGIGLNAPTGSVGKRVNTGNDYVGYGLQLGSGTWEVRPSITYGGQADRFSWGAQVSAVKRLQSKNSSGYALGDMAQVTAWGSYNILDWLSASLRGVGTAQDSIHGQFKSHITPVQIGDKIVNGQPERVYANEVDPQTVLGPTDAPGNYGGVFSDVGFGLSAVVPGGAFAGDRLSLEWLLPVTDHVSGYQLKRTGTLSISWNFEF